MFACPPGPQICLHHSGFNCLKMEKRSKEGEETVLIGPAVDRSDGVQAVQSGLGLELVPVAAETGATSITAWSLVGNADKGLEVS